MVAVARAARAEAMRAPSPPPSPPPSLAAALAAPLAAALAAALAAGGGGEGKRTSRERGAGLFKRRNCVQTASLKFLRHPALQLRSRGSSASGPQHRGKYD